jgi:hypothetical protein
VFEWRLGTEPVPEDRVKKRGNIKCHPADGVSTLSWWWDLSASETLRAMPAVAYLLVGSRMPDRSRGRSQTKRDTLVHQVGDWA